MRIYYDDLAKNIVLGTSSRLFATGSLIADIDRGRISIVYKETNYPEAFVKFDVVKKQDGTPAGLTIGDVVSYLNTEFNKTPFTGGGGDIIGVAIDGGNATMTYTAPALRIDFGKST